MEIKRNEATINRPEGDRVLDAPYVFVDIPSFIEQVKQEKAWEKSDRNGITVFKSDNLTVVITALQASAEIRENSVDGLLTLQVIKGEARVTMPDGDMTMTDNQMLAIHPGLVHSVLAITDTVFLLSNYTMDEKK